MTVIDMKKSYLLLEEKHHDAVAQHYASRRKSDYIWEVPEELLLLDKKYFPKGSVVIDMGCGPAISVENILGVHVLKNIIYYGIDISKEMLKLAKKNIPTGSFIHGDISSPKFKKRSADVIISLGALHHIEDKVVTLQRWASLLKRGGYMLLREPTYEALKRGHGESPIEEGVKFEELKKSLKKNNLAIVTYKFFTTPAFHLFNRVLIKIGLSKWQRYRILWIPVVLIDTFFANSLGHMVSFFRGEAFTLVLQKE